MKRQCDSLNQETDDWKAESEAFAAYEQMQQAIAAFLRSHDDVRISLARVRETGDWFVLLNSLKGIGQLSTTMLNGTSAEHLASQVDLLYGRLGLADKQAAKEIEKIGKPKEEPEHWELW